MSLGRYGKGSVIGNELLDLLGNYMVITTSAGNNGEGHASYFPACHSLTIAVGAYNKNGSKRSSSGFQPYVRLAAPGTGVWAPDMLGTTPINGYPKGYVGPFDSRMECSARNGTSYSSPIVAAVAAVILGREPELSPSQVADRVYLSGKPAQNPFVWGSGFDMRYLDAYSAVAGGGQ